MNPIGNQETGVGTQAAQLADPANQPEPHHFGGKTEAPALKDLEKYDDSDAGSDVFAQLVAAEVGHDIKFKTLSWQKVTVLLFGEYVCLAIAAQAWSFSVLGYVGGILTTFITGLIAYYTSYQLWRFYMARPGEIHNIADVGFLLFGRSKIAYEATAILLLLNNIFLMGFHVLTGAKILNTLSDHSLCTTDFSLIIIAMSIVLSIPRTLKHVSYMSVVSAFFMFIALLTGLIFCGIEDHPVYGYGGVWPKAGDRVVSLALAPAGTTWIDGTNALLNITFLWIGQILYPSFIAEMERPQDFPKALVWLTGMEFILFVVPAIVGYRYLGQYATAPFFGSLSTTYKKVSFGFVIVPTIVIGVIYANVANKYLYSRVMRSSRHAHSNSIIGWGVWIALMITIWFIAFVIGSVIPSFGDFLSIMSSAFDSWFGSIFWVAAYWHLERQKGFFRSPFISAQTVLNVAILAYGLFMLGPGLYTSIEAIIADYAGPVKNPFSCADNSL